MLQRRPPQREGRGKETGGPPLSPDRRHQPAGARAEPAAGRRASTSRTGATPAAFPPPGPRALPARRRRPPVRRPPRKGRKGRSPRPRPAGDAAVYVRRSPGRPRRQGALGAAGDGAGAGRAAFVHRLPPSARPPAASRRPIYPERVGGEPGSALPFSRPPSSAPAAHFEALRRRRARLVPPARPLAAPPAPPAVAPWGVPRQAPHTAVPPAFGRGASPPTRHHRAAVSLCWFPSLLSEFSLSSVRFLPQFCQTFPSVLIFIPLPPPHLPTQLFPSVSGRVGMREELFSKTIIPLHFEEAEGGFTKASGDCGSVGYRSSQAHHSPCASHPLMAVLNTSRLVQPKPWSLSLTGSTAAGPQPPRSWPPHPSRCVFHHKCNGGVFQIPAKPLAGRSSMCQRQCRHWGKWRVHIDPQGSEKQAAVKHVRLAEADMDIYCTITGWC